MKIVLDTIERLAAGNPGDVKAVGEGVSELRIDYGPGYRVYYKKQGQKVIILLAGGDKHTQAYRNFFHVCHLGQKKDFFMLF